MVLEGLAARRLGKSQMPYKLFGLLLEEAFEFFYQSFILGGYLSDEGANHNTFNKAFLKKSDASNRPEGLISVAVNARSNRKK